MNPGRLILLLIASLLTVAWADVARARDDGAELLYAGPGGEIALQGESRLIVRGVSGTIGVRAARDDSLIFQCRSLEDRRTEKDVELWLSGRNLILTAPEGQAAERRLIELALAPGMDLQVEVVDSHVQITGLQGELEFDGVGSSLEVRGVYGSATATMEGGRLFVDFIEDDFDLETSDLDAEIRRVGGALSVDQTGGSLTLSHISGEAQLQLNQVVLQGEEFGERVELDAEGGTARLDKVRRGMGGRFNEAPLQVSDLRGLARIESDSKVVVRGAQSPLTVENYGGEIRVSENSGPTSLRNVAGNIIAEKIGGPLEISGDELQVLVREPAGNLVLNTVSSSIRVEQAGGPVALTNEFGDVFVLGAAADVTISSRNGDVTARDLQGGLNLQADGAQVEVVWKALPTEGECIVRNESGGVRVELPARATGEFKAESNYGRVSSTVSGIRVSDDERRAVGLLGGRNTPSIQIEADGDVDITSVQVRRPQ